MFSAFEALRYRSLRYVRRSLDRFHVLVGPNASGKSTFLDIPRFLSDLMKPAGIEAAIDARTVNWHDLVWKRADDFLELVVEAQIPDELRERIERPEWSVCRYQVRLGLAPDETQLGILGESLILGPEEASGTDRRNIEFFPRPSDPPGSIFSSLGQPGRKTIVNKTPGGNDNFYDETGKGWSHAFKLGPQRSALGHVPEDVSKFPVATWFKRKLTDAVTFIQLESSRMRKASPPGRGTRFRPDGSNLPWVVRSLREDRPKRFRQWREHLQTYFPRLTDVSTNVMEDTRRCYLRAHYRGHDNPVPSWGFSDGTLRMFALTLLAFIDDLKGTVLIEEPENGIHPQGIETVFEALSSVYDTQILVATHSPVMLSVTEPEQLLCFGQDENGATDVVLGSDHPRLRRWKRETDLGTLFAGGCWHDRGRKSFKVLTASARKKI